MIGFNKCVLWGVMVETMMPRTHANGLPIANGRLRVTSMRKRDGTEIEYRTLIPLRFVGSLATAAADKARQGVPVIVEGRIDPDHRHDEATGVTYSSLLVHVYSFSVTGLAAYDRVEPAP